MPAAFRYGDTTLHIVNNDAERDALTGVDVGHLVFVLISVTGRPQMWVISGVINTDQFDPNSAHLLTDAGTQIRRVETKNERVNLEGLEENTLVFVNTDVDQGGGHGLYLITQKSPDGRWAGSEYKDVSPGTSSGGPSGSGNETVFAATLPATGLDGDQVAITGGDVAGAVYARQTGSWVFVGQFREQPRTSHPATASLPVGFMWRLILQTDPDLNGLYQWDGFNVVQITTDGFAASGPVTAQSQYVHQQTVAAAVWSVAHNLGGDVDTVSIWVGGQRVYADVNIVNTNNLTITFASPAEGIAIVEL